MTETCQSSNPWTLVNNQFTDFNFEYCTDKRFSYDQTRQSSSADERLAWTHREPDSVDVDLLSDDEIASTCLTIQDCIMPPILTMIRVKETKDLWRPAQQIFKNPENDKMCCDPSSIYFLPPEGNNGLFYKGTAVVKVVKQTRYPRGSSYADAKIIRVDFDFSSLQLYTYIDITCSAGKNFARRNGFLGQNMARTNGIFQEIVFEGIQGPNTHTPVNQLRGIATTKADFLETSSTKSIATRFKFIGPFDTATKTYKWISWWQSWITVSGATNNELMLVYIIAAIDWLKLSPPKGNLPVGFLYFYQALSSLNTKQWKYDTDFLARYFGQMFYAHKDSLDYLFELVGSNQLPRFKEETGDFMKCYNQLPENFRSAFTNLDNPPEKACADGKLDCPAWTGYVKCPNTMKMLTTAVSKSLYNSVIQTPRCNDCPGLVGNFREVVPPTNKWRTVFQKFPQCLPFRVNDTYSIEDPLDLTGVPEPTPAPTRSPSIKPTRKPVSTPSSDSPSDSSSDSSTPTTTSPSNSNSNDLYWLLLLILPLFFIAACWVRRRRSTIRPTWSLLDHTQ